MQILNCKEEITIKRNQLHKIENTENKMSNKRNTEGTKYSK